MTSRFPLRGVPIYKQVCLIVVGRVNTFKHSRDHDCYTMTVVSTTDVRISRGSECGYTETGYVRVVVVMYEC